MKKTLLACALLLPALSHAQIKIGNNPGTIDPASILELEHPNKALYFKGVSLISTTDVTTVPSPKAGMVVFNTNVAINFSTTNPALNGGIGLYIYDGTRWVGAGVGQSTGNFWRLQGNTGINPATDFLGTSDANPLSIRTRDSLRALFRADGTMAFTNALPLYADNIAEFRLNNVGGSATNGEQNQGLNVLGQARNGAAQSIAVRGRNNVVSGSTAATVRGIQGNANVEGTATGGVTAGYFNSSVKGGGALGPAASLTGVAADAEANSGSSTAATNTFTGGRFGATATNAPASRTVGVLAAGQSSTTSNLGAVGLAGDTAYANYARFIAATPAGYNAGIVGLNPGSGANNYAGDFLGKSQATQSAAVRITAAPGNAIPTGNELFGSITSITGSDAATAASATQTTLRGQVNQASTAGSNVRVQGSLNEASSSGTGLGQYGQPQSTGATGLADYTGTSDAPTTDFLVGLRGAAYTASNKTNGLNVVGMNFGGTYYRSVGGYFAPSAGSDANLGIVAQTGGTANSGWKDAQFAGKNISVAAINTGTTANDYAGYFTGSNNATASSVLRANNNAGVVADGSDLFASHNSITGTNSSAAGNAATIRAQYNNASSASNNMRVQGALNEASTAGQGLGAASQPQATGVTGLADYVGNTDAPTSDYLVGVRGAAYTASNKTNGLNIVGANFGGSFFRSVGGYFAPSSGTDANLGVVAQTGGTANQGWKDPALTGANAAVAAMDYNTGNGNHAALITQGPVRMTQLTGTGTNLVTIDPATGAIGSVAAPATPAPAWLLTGNAGLTTANFIGTTDAQQFAVRTNNVQRALFRADGSISLGNSVPVYADNKFEINLVNVGGTQNNGEQNQGVNVLASALNGSNLSVGVRGRMDIPSGSSVANARGLQGNVNVSGTANSATGGYFSAALRNGGALGTNASITGIAADAETGGGTMTSAATNSFIGGRFGANPQNATASRATGVLAAANNSAASNVGVYGLSNDAGYASYGAFNAAMPTGFGAAFVGINPANANNNYAAYFLGKNKTQYSSAVRVVSEPGNAITPGTELFASQTTISGDDGANASASPTTLRAQVNQASSASNNARTQGALNEASSSGTGLGQFNQPQANGATGLADYVGAADAPVTDYIAGVRGAAYTSGKRTNGINVIGANFGGNYYRSVGGYFAPSAGTDANLGIVAQTGGTANSGWRDAQFAGKNISVAAISTGTTANDHAGYFTGSNNATASSVLRVNNNAGVVADGSDLFASHNSITGTNSSAAGSPATIRAQYNNASSASNNMRVQGALNEASTAGQGLGTANTPQATGVTGLADYVGSSDAPTSDYLVGIRGAAYTASNKTNGLNVVGANFGGSYYRSVGGYFAPTSGTDANLGVVAQTGGAENQAWKDAALNSTNAAVTAMDYNTSGNHLALYSSGPVQMKNIGTTTGNTVVGIDGSGKIGTLTLPNIISAAENGLTATSGTVRLGGPLTANTTIATTTGANNYDLDVNGGGNLTVSGSGRLGVGTTAPGSKLSVNGSFGAAILATSSNVNLDETHHTVIITGGSPTINLPAASTCPGRIYRIINGTPSNMSFSGNSYIDFTGGPIYTIRARNRTIVQSDGTNWYLID